MRPALDPAGHQVPRTKSTCLLHTWRPHRQRPFVLVLHLHQRESSRNLHLQYLAKNQSTQHCQSLITQGSDHPPVLEPHMVLISYPCCNCLEIGFPVVTDVDSRPPTLSIAQYKAGQGVLPGTTSRPSTGRHVISSTHPQAIYTDNWM
jgi:hypothetical protein